MNDAANVVAVDHTGFAVSSLDDAVRFWTGALGFTLERQSEMGGDFLHQVTGVDDPSVKTAIVRAPDGYVVELLQYSRGHQNGAVPSSAGSIGAAHLALTVKDIHAAIARVEAAGWKAKGSPLPIAGGTTEGYVGGIRFRTRSYHDRAYAAAGPLMSLRKFSRFTIPLGKSWSPAMSAIATRLPEIRRTAFHPIADIRKLATQFAANLRHW